MVPWGTNRSAWPSFFGAPSLEQKLDNENDVGYTVMNFYLILVFQYIDAFDLR